MALSHLQSLWLFPPTPALSFSVLDILQTLVNNPNQAKQRVILHPKQDIRDSEKTVFVTGMLCTKVEGI